MNLHVIVQNRNAKKLIHWFPKLPQALTSEKADLSLFNHRGKDHLDAALAQAASSSSLAASVDRGGKALEAL